MFTIRFWGVRGSIASAGPGNAAVGGNTSCVEVRTPDAHIVLDAGTGLRPLGSAMLASGVPADVHLFLSHFHWDHIQGFPFFAPAYVPGGRVKLYGPERALPRGQDVRAALDAQMRPPHFPIGLDAMRAQLAFQAVAAGAVVCVGQTEVRAAAACHPGGCLAYRVEHGGHSVVYATDTEHEAGGQLDASLLELARDADVLIYDAQYTAEEYPHKRGWGHSTPDEGVRLARAAGVRRLVLFHHDPAHDDWAIARIEAQARAAFPATVAAREGLVLEQDGWAEVAA